MASTLQSMFSWQAVESSPEILRFRLVLEQLDDEELMNVLEAERGHARDDYPIRAVWNAMIAGIVFRHETRAALIGELLRNGELRQACGFDPLLGARAVPDRFVFNRLTRKLVRHQDLLGKVFRRMVEKLAGLLSESGFGRSLAIDSKALRARGKQDKEADVGTKTKPAGEDGDGEVVFHWRGYKLHLLCDAVHEMPLAFEVTRANEADSPHLMPLVKRYAGDHQELAEKAVELSADMGYDDGEDKAALYDDYGIVPLIPSRNLAGGAMKPLDETRHDTVYVSPKGEIRCKIRPFAERDEEAFAAMQYQGFEKDRGTLKFRCPAGAYGIECKNREACRRPLKEGGFGRIVRVKLDSNRRLHQPLYAASQSFADRYRRRTSVERLFSRLDNLFGFERPQTLGLKPTIARVTIVLSSMLAIAAGWIAMDRQKDMRRIRAA